MGETTAIILGALGLVVGAIGSTLAVIAILRHEKRRG